jgi:hypothetical protein
MTLLMLLCAAALAADEKPASVTDSRLHKMYLEDARRWEMWVGPDQQQKAELLPEPVFRWQNLARANGQSGEMFVWLFEGRPVVIGGVFSNPAGKGRDVLHEFHSLGPDRLYPVLSESEHQWTPKAGVTLQALPDSPKVEATAGKRTLQMRSIGRDFAARSVEPTKQRWELRLLPKPLYRYERPQGDVIDGALLAFVSDAGTDPEIILILEARRDNTGDTVWYYRPVRMSISDLHVDYKGNRVWTSLRDDPEVAFGNKDETYYLWRDRAIDELPPE